jgi:hypothetical protein
LGKERQALPDARLLFTGLLVTRSYTHPFFLDVSISNSYTNNKSNKNHAATTTNFFNDYPNPSLTF